MPETVGVTWICPHCQHTNMGGWDECGKCHWNRKMGGWDIEDKVGSIDPEHPTYQVEMIGMAAGWSQTRTDLGAKINALMQEHGFRRLASAYVAPGPLGEAVLFGVFERDR